MWPATEWRCKACTNQMSESWVLQVLGETAGGGRGDGTAKALWMKPSACRISCAISDCEYL